MVGEAMKKWMGMTGRNSKKEGRSGGELRVGLAGKKGRNRCAWMVGIARKKVMNEW
jgi:hypothetical protein